MKLLSKRIEKDTTGFVKLIPEDGEDMWGVYNLIQKGDRVEASTVRGVKTETSTGSVSSERVRITLTIQVEKVYYDVQAGALRINGKTVVQNKYVQLGQYHTLDLECGYPFTIHKANGWDTVNLQRIEEVCDVDKQAELGAIVMQESGIASICLITKYLTVVKQKITVTIPKKRKNMSIIQYEKSINSFYEKIFMGMKTCFLNNGNSGTANYGKNIKAVIVGSPGGIMADKFILYCKQHLDGSSNNKTFLDKLLKVSCASGHKSSLEQVLKEPSVIAKLGDIKATQEVALLDKLFFLLNKNTEDIECTTTSVLFGYSSINKAFEAQNYAPTLIKFLLVSDSIFNTDDFAHRKRLVDFVDTLKSSTSAEIVTFSSLHYSGEQLVSMGGMAAILNYPIVEEDEEVGTGERKSEDGRKRTASANQDNANSSEVDHYDTDTDSESVKGTLIT